MASTVNYTLPDNSNIELLSMLGSGLTGTGSSGADTLHSSSGPNTLVGLGGDDLYYVNNAGDVVIEAANGGFDTVPRPSITRCRPTSRRSTCTAPG